MIKPIHKTIVFIIALGFVHNAFAQMSLRCFFGKPTRFPEFSYDTVNSFFEWDGGEYLVGFHRQWVYRTENIDPSPVAADYREVDMESSGSSEWSYAAHFSGT